MAATKSVTVAAKTAASGEAWVPAGVPKVHRVFATLVALPGPHAMLLGDDGQGQLRDPGAGNSRNVEVRSAATSRWGWLLMLLPNGR